MCIRDRIMPVGSWKEKWDLTILFLIFYSAVTVPLRVCFAAPAQGFMWLLEVSMTLVFIYDVYLNFRTVYFDSRAGMWVTGRPQLAQRYLTSWFWIDAPSSVPVELISVVFDAHNLSILRILRMVRASSDSSSSSRLRNTSRRSRTTLTSTCACFGSSSWSSRCASSAT